MRCIVLISLLVLVGCENGNNNLPERLALKHYTTIQLDEDLFVYTYVEEFGVYLSTKYYVYITDSDALHFVYVGSHDDYGRILFDFTDGGSLWVRYYSDALQPVPTESKLFLISRFKSQKIDGK